MAHGRREHDWSMTAELMALTANLNRDPKKRPRPFEADEMNPMKARAKPRAQKDTKLAFKMMKDAFTTPRSTKQ